MEYKWNMLEIITRIKQYERKQKLTLLEKKELAGLRNMLGVYDENAILCVDGREELECINHLIPNMYLVWANERLSNITLPEPKKLALPKNEMLTIVHDFYKTQPSIFYEAFLTSYQQREKILNFSNRESCIYYLPIEKNFYINIEDDKTIQSLFHLVLEFGYALASKINPQIEKENFLFLSELSGYYFQHQFFDYLFQNQIYPQEALSFEINVFQDLNEQIFCGIENQSITEDTAIFFHSYTTSIALAMQEKGASNFTRILKARPKTMLEGITLVNRFVTSVDEIEAYQDKLLTLKKRETKLYK